MYQMYIRSVLTYAGAVWGPHISPTHWKSIEAVQNITIRIISDLPPTLSLTITTAVYSAAPKTSRKLRKKYGHFIRPFNNNHVNF